jgi:hypothetical protein
LCISGSDVESDVLPLAARPLLATLVDTRIMGIRLVPESKFGLKNLAHHLFGPVYVVRRGPELYGRPWTCQDLPDPRFGYIVRDAIFSRAVPIRLFLECKHARENFLYFARATCEDWEEDYHPYG